MQKIWLVAKRKEHHLPPALLFLYLTLWCILTQPYDIKFIYRKTNHIKMKKILFFTLIGLTILSCSNDDDNENPVNCDFETVISTEQYANAPSDQLTINSLDINDNCLKINFSSGGCSGDTWVLKLIDSGDILESLPPQRNLRLSLKNEELCEAYITKEIIFDISNLQVDGNQVQLNITNGDESILYEY